MEAIAQQIGYLASNCEVCQKALSSWKRADIEGERIAQQPEKIEARSHSE